MFIITATLTGSCSLCKPADIRHGAGSPDAARRDGCIRPGSPSNHAPLFLKLARQGQGAHRAPGKRLDTWIMRHAYAVAPSCYRSAAYRTVSIAIFFIFITGAGIHKGARACLTRRDNPEDAIIFYHPPVHVLTEAAPVWST